MSRMELSPFGSLSRLSFVLFFLFFFAWRQYDQVHCFDVGFHYDLATAALDRFQFSATAKSIVIGADTLVDYYNYFSWNTIGLDAMHFDTVDKKTKVINYWIQLAKNTNAEVKAITAEYTNAEDEKDEKEAVIKLLVLLGMSLHPVQDFYSHSTWVNHHERKCDCYRGETIFSYLREDLTHLLPDNLQTGHAEDTKVKEFNGDYEHGEYCDGLNKDSYNRPNFEPAFVHAYVGSIEWINAVQSWIAPLSDKLWDAARNLEDKSTMNKMNNENQYFNDIATFVNIKDTHDGHWKGSGSGAFLRFFHKSMGFYSAPGTKRGHYFRNGLWKKIAEPPLYDLDQDYNPSEYRFLVPELPVNFVQIQALVIRTVHIKAGKDDDVFAKIRVGGNDDDEHSGTTYIESSMRNQGDRPVPWTTIAFFDASSSLPTDLPIRYSLYDSDEASGSDRIDINPNSDSKELDFTYDMNQELFKGDTISGVHNDSSSAVEIGGDKGYKAQIKLYITTRRVVFPTKVLNSFVNNCTAISGQETCESGLSAFENQMVKYCAGKGRKEANEDFDRGLTAIILPIVIVLLVLISIPILICWKKKKLCFHRERFTFDEYQLDEL